jgi:hypothetical protein
MAKEILHRVIYGEGQVTNNPAKAHLASQLSIRPAILHNYCRHRVARADYPGMIPKSGHSVRGTYVTGLTDADVARLDMFEGDEYTREKVKVRVLIPSASGESESEELEAESYVYTAGEGYLEKKEWDYEEFRREKMHRWTGESQEFKGWLANVLHYGCGVSKKVEQRPMSTRRVPMRSLSMMEVEAS